MWVKICGVRDPKTADALARLGVDAVGLNFFAKSVRAVSPEEAAQVVRALAGRAEPVGLFVNHSLEEIVETCSRCGLRTVQLHGDEPPEWLARLREKLPGVRVVRAFRLDERGVGPVREYLQECTRLNARPDYCLVDALVPGKFGGTGQTAPWSLVAAQYDRQHWPPLVLAGGLKPDNVAEAIRAVRPWGVDTASGVESAPGRKDLTLCRAFVERARLAFEQLERHAEPESGLSG